MSDAKRDKAVKQMKFDEALAELEALVERIESGEVGLEEALKQYERGIALIDRCRTVLGAAEQRIAELTADAAGKLEVVEGEADNIAQGGDSADESEDTPL
ncbi:MAG: exodeoxyribonuclease VII small subunit [Phycisphaeraceae bacterium]